MSLTLNVRGVALAVIAAAALLAVACGGGDTNVTVAGAEQTGISVSGTGTVTVAPDVAVLIMGVEVTRETVAEAREEAAAANQAIRDSLERDGVEERDVATQFFNIYPQYVYEERRAPEIIGFTVTNQLRVKVRELDSVSDVLDGAIDAAGDAVRVQSISFTIDEPEQFFDQARADAMADARERAEQLAGLAGVSLGPPRTISESRGGGPIPFPGDAGGFGLEAQAATPISPGETEITLTVFVVYGIE